MLTCNLNQLKLIFENTLWTETLDYPSLFPSLFLLPSFQKQFQAGSTGEASPIPGNGLASMQSGIELE